MSTKEINLGSHEEAARRATGSVVIIDVFRAFTTAAVALANGADKIVMVGDLTTALSLREQGVGQICMGERGGDRPEGFDFGNSPAEILDTRFDGKTLIQTTSNGTRGIVAAVNADKVYTGSLINADATADVLLRDSSSEITLVAMGNGVERTDEDELCALYLRSRLTGLQPDKAALRTAIATMSKRTDGRSLSQGDIDACLSIGTVPFAISVAKEGAHWVARAEAV